MTTLQGCAPVAGTMWALLERVAYLERRVGALYTHFAAHFRQRPLVAAFWDEMAGEERLHALLVAATREVFPVTAPVPAGEWAAQLARIEQQLGEFEARAAAGVPAKSQAASSDRGLGVGFMLSFFFAGWPALGGRARS